ncbi:MAG: bifunctional transaldolase/phosoglucose isomerase [Planctomycetes bacterium]|nr:bifunctional transaldolase/phosoglucose isomerase [Planctomycetota bacterium]
MNPLMQLTGFGQSVWLDYIRRSLLTSGELKRLIAEDGLRGVTSNPAIFEKAIAGSSDYEATIDQLRADKSRSAKDIYEQIAIKDIQDAADQLQPVYQSTNRRDGYVSLEVSPELAYDTKGTIEEALRLWRRVARENVMIKVPATPQGVPAIKELLSQGLNVNVTLLFALEAYEKVADAYISGLEAFAAKGGDLRKVASVASFFISRIDSLVDSVAGAKLKASTNPAESGLVKSVMGRVAIANARITYQRYKDIVASPRWQALAKKGAQTQRLLWASTSTKNASFRDVIYVEELIGADTVNTIPPATYDAFRDHGRPRKSLEEGLDDAHDTMETMAKVGISMEEVTGKLLDEGVRLFADAFEKLLAAVEAKRATAPVTVSAAKARNASLPKAIADEVDATLRDWQKNGKVQKLWAGDASLWTGADEARWVGWLGVTDDQLAHIDHLESMAKEARAEGFTHALLLGMGGSSLCPEVMRMTFGKVAGFPELCVLDSTDPAQIRAIEKRVDLAKTLFIVSSKSGGTLEPNIFQQYFFARAKDVVGAAKVGSRFIAVTDPGSKMQQVAEGNGFRHVFFGLPTIGGRYSALSDFGMVPAAVMGVDVRRFLDRASQMVQSCKACVPAEENPGVALGAILGVCGKNGRDKVTLIASPGISDLGAWLEQLLAESTGKIGRGLVPVDREKLGPPESYGNDRVFAYTRLEPAPDPKQDEAVAALEKAGHPVVRISVKDPYDLGQEFFRWEIATAVAGSILGINPFDQPDVEASKVATRKLTSEYETTGSLRPETPFLEAEGVKLFSDSANVTALTAAIAKDRSLAGALRAHLGRVKAGDYVGILGYVEMNAAHEDAMQGIRTRVRDKKRVATCLGFGPRFLHSTGQAYKGGPNSGVFIQVTADDAQDLPVPGAKYTFGVVKAAQARGDFDVLAERGRRALRVHLGKDVAAGLATLRRAIDAALA